MKTSLLIFAIVSSVVAQEEPPTVCDTYGVEKSFAVNTVDTIYFALPPEYGWTGFIKTDTTTGFNTTSKFLAQRFRWNGDGKFSIDLISGNVADSMKIAVYSVTKYITSSGVQAVLMDINSIAYLSGDASNFSNVPGNGNSNAFAITSALDPSPALAFVVTMSDTVGGTRRFRFALTPR